VIEPSWEHLSEEQLRKIISNYLDEVLRYYQEQQRIELNGFGSEGDHRLEQRASELLGAMTTSLDPGERRKPFYKYCAGPNILGITAFRVEGIPILEEQNCSKIVPRFSQFFVEFFGL
jgi:hypothetical protein